MKNLKLFEEFVAEINETTEINEAKMSTKQAMALANQIINRGVNPETREPNQKLPFSLSKTYKLWSKPGSMKGSQIIATMRDYWKDDLLKGGELMHSKVPMPKEIEVNVKDNILTQGDKPIKDLSQLSLGVATELFLKYYIQSLYDANKAYIKNGTGNALEDHAIQQFKEIRDANKGKSPIAFSRLVKYMKEWAKENNYSDEETAKKFNWKSLTQELGL